jgi:PAS domain S-box-containing protein
MSAVPEPSGLRRPSSPNEGLAELSEKILSAATQQALAAHTCSSASVLTNSRCAIVREVDRMTGRLRAPGPEEHAGILALGSDNPDVCCQVESLLEEVAAQRSPLLITGAEVVRRRTAAGAGSPQVPRLLAVPALSGDRVVGVIAVADAPQDYTPEDVAVVKRHATLYCLARQRLDLENELRESEVRYRDIIESSHELVQSVRPDGTFDFVNQAWLRTMGYAPDEVTRLSVFDVIAPDLIPHCQELFGRIMQGESIGDHETAFVAKGGNRVLLQGSMIPRLAGGRVVATHAFFRDVTELRKTEKFVKDVLESVDEAFVVIDRDYRVLNANRVYCQLAGKTLAEVVGKHCYTLTHGLAQPCSAVGDGCPVLRVFGSGEPHSAFHSRKTPDGATLYLEIKAFPVRDHSGTIVSAIEIVNDVTEEKRLEDQLRTAQKMEAVGLLAGGVAHDFNNLLQAILGYGSILKARLKPDDPLAQHVEQILMAGDQAAELTRGLLAFSRKQVVNPAVADLNEIVRGLCKILQRVIGEDIEMRIFCDGQPLTVFVDQSQIVQILMNLTTNARDSMPRGGTLTIETGRFVADELYVAAKLLDRAGPYASLTISDSGLGMDRATAERIFEPFYTTKELGRGTGLGLSIVYGIIKRHHGYINVSSEPGMGTTFKILLPLIDEAPRIPAAETPRPAGGTETILLAEDEPSVRSLLMSVLGDAGYTVIEAADGEAALDAFRRNRDEIKLALLDVIMPKLNGREVSEEIGRIAPGVRTIFMSGYTDDVIARRGLLDEGIQLIVKPVAPAVFLAAVRAALDKR